MTNFQIQALLAGPHSRSFHSSHSQLALFFSGLGKKSVFNWEILCFTKHSIVIMLRLANEKSYYRLVRILFLTI